MIRNAFEYAPQAMAIYGIEGDLLWVNNACSMLFELSDIWQSEHMAASIPNKVPQPQRETLRQERQLSVEFNVQGKAQDIESVKTAAKRIIGASLRPVYSEANELEGFIAVFTDVTQSRKDEELRRRLLIATNLGDKVLMMTNSQGEIEYVNTAFIRSTGYTEKEVLGKNPRVFKSGLMHAEVYRRMWSSLDRGETWQGELLNRKKSGELFWEQVIITPVPASQGEGIHYLAVKENITERKLLRGRLEMLQGVMRVMSSESVFEKSAPKLARIIAESLAAGWVEIWVQDKDRESLCCLATHVIGGVLKPSASMPKVGDRITRDSDHRYAALDSLGHVRLNTADARSVLAFPIRTEQGGAGLLMLGDLVNTSSVIPAIDLVCAQLGHFLQRTRMESEILKARDIAEAASRAKSAFLSNMSHELRTPLNAILSLSQLMSTDQQLSVQVQRQVEAIERSGLELLSLINAILDISRVVSTSALQQSPLAGISSDAGKLETVRRILEENGANETAPTAPRRDTPVPQPPTHQSQSTENLLKRIRGIAERADIDSLNRAIDELAKLEPSLAMSLRQHTELYDYDAILAITTPIRAEPKNEALQ